MINSNEKSLNCTMSAKTSATVIRTRLYDYIRIADDKKLQAIYNLLEPQIDTTAEWWKDKKMLAEFDARSKALESGTDKGYTLDELDASINKIRQEQYGK
jgi:hypothetical protein